MVAGYIINNSFSLDEPKWRQVFSLVFDIFHAQESLLSDNDLIESVNVSMANFLDAMIDYPKSKEYAFVMFERLEKIQLISQSQL